MATDEKVEHEPMRYGIDGRYIQDHFPGIGRYTYNLILHLGELAVDDTLLVFYNPESPNRRYDLGILAEKSNVTLVPVSAGVFSLRQQTIMPRLARKQQLHLFHSPYYIPPYALPCPTIATIHDLIPYLYPESLPNARLRWLFMLFVRLTLLRAKFVLADSESTRRDLLRKLNARPEHVMTVPLGVGGSFYPREEMDIAQMRERFHIDGPYILYLGVNKPHKNLVRLIQAWHGLSPDSRAKYTLILAGYEDPRYPEVRQCIKRLELGSEVRLLGAIENRDVPLLYSGACCFLFPSLYEGFGLPVLEAMACGTPVVCSNTSSLLEIVGAAALTFDPLDVTEMAAKIEEALRSEALREEMREKGLRQAAQFSWERTARDTLGVYREAVK